jgi:ATP-binding cassette subfamily B protein
VSDKIFKADFTAMTYEGAIDAVTFLAVGLFLWAGAYQVLNGRLSIGGLVAFNSLVALANTPIRNLLVLWDNLQRCDVLLNRVDDVLQQEPEQGHDRSALRPVSSLAGHVTLSNVGFRYGGPEAPAILEHVTLDVPAGKVVAIVGRSGSGKTTVAKCMAGLLEPTEGTILYDGLDLRTLNYRDLRRQIGFVLQDSYVFADTIARNIAFGEDEPDMDRVAWAADVAGASEFVTRLPFGYDTRIGETGLALDPASGNLWYGSTQSPQVVELTSSGSEVRRVDLALQGVNDNEIAGLAFDAAGRLLVASTQGVVYRTVV